MDFKDPAVEIDAKMAALQAGRKVAFDALLPKKSKNSGDLTAGKVIKPFGKKNPTELEADIFASKLETYGRKKYANGSVPEDAKEEIQRIKNTKLLKKGEDEKIKKEKDPFMENYFDAMKGYKPDKAENVEKIQPEVDPNKRATKPLIVEDTEKPKEVKEKEKLSELEKQLDKARKAFIGMDMEAEKKASKFWKLFRVGSLGEYGEEQKAAKEKYYAALMAYKDEYLNVHGLNEKSVAEMVHFFNIKEHYSLESARLDTSNEDAGWPKKVWNGYMGMIDRYRKIGENDKSKFKKYFKKIAASMFVAVAAVGAAAGGGALAGAAGTIAGAALVRSLTIGVSSVGFKAMYESLAQGSRRRESEREMAYISRNLKEPSLGESYYDQVMQNLDEKINSMDEIMQEQKQRKRFRTIAAVGTAVVISQAGRCFGGWASEKMSHWFGGTGVPTNEIPATEPGDGAATPEIKPPIEKTIDLTVEKDSNLEGTLTDYLEKGKMDHDAAGREAHLRMLEYAKKKGIPFEKLNHVLPGQEIELNPDGTVKNIPGFESAPADIPMEPKVEVVPDNIENPEINVVPDNIPPEANVFPENPGFDRAHESVFGHNTDNFLDSAEREMFNAERGYGGNYGSPASPTPGPGPESVWFANAKFSHGFLSNFRDQIVAGDPEKATDILHKAIAPEGNWEEMKNVTFNDMEALWKREAVLTDEGLQKFSRLNEVFKSLRKVLGESVMPRNWPKVETMSEWTKRVAEIAAEQANKNIK